MTRSLSRGQRQFHVMSETPQSIEDGKHAPRALPDFGQAVDARLENLAQVLWLRSSAAGHDRQELVPHVRREVSGAHVRQCPQHVAGGLIIRAGMACMIVSNGRAFIWTAADTCLHGLCLDEQGARLVSAAARAQVQINWRGNHGESRCWRRDGGGSWQRSALYALNRTQRYCEQSGARTVACKRPWVTKHPRIKHTRAWDSICTASDTAQCRTVSKVMIRHLSIHVRC